MGRNTGERYEQGSKWTRPRRRHPTKPVQLIEPFGTGGGPDLLARALAPHAYEVRPRKDKRGVDLISDVLPFGSLWYDGPNAASNAIGYASQYSRSADAVIRVYDASGNVIETHEHAGDFKEP
jgi:hypothetical protein